MAQTDGLSDISSLVTINSTNNISLFDKFAYPITVELEEGISYAYDLRKYFVHSNPYCQVDRFQIFQIFDPEADKFLSTTEINLLFKINQYGTLQFLDTSI
jgi:hypothetical protein